LWFDLVVGAGLVGVFVYSECLSYDENLIDRFLETFYCTTIILVPPRTLRAFE
jgi:hypothetical protein